MTAGFYENVHGVFAEHPLASGNHVKSAGGAITCVNRVCDVWIALNPPVVSRYSGNAPLVVSWLASDSRNGHRRKVGISIDQRFYIHIDGVVGETNW